MFKKTKNVQYEMYICSGISGSGKSFVALGLILKNYLLNFNRSICSEKSNLLYSYAIVIS